MTHDPSPLVGRASVLAQLARSARSGRGLVLTGPPGSGGTRLLTDAYCASRRAGVRVARVELARSPEAIASDPFLALLDRTTLGRLPSGEPGAARAATVALRLQALFIDDAHLLDDAAGALIAELADSGTAVIANATGPGGMPPALRRLVTDGRVGIAALGPLTHDEVVELAGHLLGDPVDGQLGLALVTASEGRPARLGEVIDDGVGARSIVHADGLWRLAAPLPAARSVRAAVLDAFTALPTAQRGWIAAIAQAGRLADDVASRIAAPESILAVQEGGWTERDGDATSIASTAIGTAVLGSLDLRARSAVLRRLIEATEALGRQLSDGEQVALIRWRIDLGLRPDPDEALALALRPETDEGAREPLLRAAVEGGAPAGAALADHLRRTRRPAEAHALISAALPDAADVLERISLIRVQSMTIGVIERRSADALESLDAHLPEDAAHPDLLAVRAAMLLLEARPAEAVGVAERVLRTDERSGFATAFALLQSAMSHRELGRLDHALQAASRLAALDDVELAFPEGRTLATWLPSELAVAVGAEPHDAESVLADAHRDVPLEHRAARRPPLSYTLASIRLLHGDPAAAVRLLREADAGVGGWREGWQPRILSELVVSLVLSGAIEEAESVHGRLSRLTCPPVQRGRVDLARAQLAHARGDAVAARSITAGVAERGRREGLALDAFDATFAGIRYGDQEAPARLLELGDGPGGSGRAAQRAYAAALHGSGGAEAVDRASTRLWDAGLRWYAIEAAGAAVALGATDVAPRLVAWEARTPFLRLRSAVDQRALGLTTREREVALLAAAGASDRTIAAELGITLRTAQTHLGRALAKLGIHRRSELRGLVVEP